MTPTDDILKDKKHRPFEYPTSRWIYYQEWNNVLFLHWKVPFDTLRVLVPKRLNLDTVDGAAYVSLVAFTMQKIRPRNLPSIAFISDFDEVNIRTYVDNDGRKGVYFLNIEAGKTLSALVAKMLSGLPYERATISRTNDRYRSVNNEKNFILDAEFEVKKRTTEKSPLDTWLTERYCLYLDKNGATYRYDIHHKEWAIQEVNIQQLGLNYRIGGLCLTGTPDLMHYSEGVKVLAWGRTKI